MKRPFSVTLALWLVLILSAWNALKAWTALAWRDVLIEYSVQMPPSLAAGLGALWFIIGLSAAWSVWQKKSWSAKWLMSAALGYAVWHWIERLTWQNPRSNLIFAIVVTFVCLSLVAMAAKSLSREAHERNTEHPKTE